MAPSDTYELTHETLELNGGIVQGSLRVEHDGKNELLEKMDSLYLPAKDKAVLTAIDEVVIFLGGGPYEGIGSFFIRKFDADLPLGDIHQLHGEPPYQRHVFMTLNEEVPASRMINGFTWGDYGKWTSWPPHQHSADLEEVYCYFDLPSPQFALHLSSRVPRVVEAAHPVSTGDFVVIPEGYHPTVSMPGTRSSYFWIMVAHRQESRSYHLAKADFGV